MNLGPQFYQPRLPGTGPEGGEQMALFRTKELGDGTMRGSYHTSSNPDDLVESKARQRVTPRDVNETWSAPRGRTDYGVAYDETQLTEAAADRLGKGGDLAANIRNPLPSDTTNLVEGGRAHLSTIASSDSEVNRKFMDEFSSGTDFGDTRLRAKPYDFRELEFTDTPQYDEGLYAAFTPEGELVSGMEYGESSVLPRAQVIRGAGTNEPFRGRGYGKMTAGRMAAERGQEGVVLHGNTFTNAGKGAFQSKGARSEHQIRDEVEYRASHDPDILEAATEDYETPELAKWAGLDPDSDDPVNRFDYDEASDTVNVQGDVFDRGQVAKMAAQGSGAGDIFYDNPIRSRTRSYAQDYLHDEMLGDQERMISPFREHLGVPDRPSTYGQPKQPTLQDEGTSKSSTPLPPNEGRLKNFYGQRGEAQPQDVLTRMLREDKFL